MLGIEQVKILMENPNLSDKEAEDIRDACRSLAEIIFEHWNSDKAKVQMTNKDNENEQKEQIEGVPSNI